MRLFIPGAGGKVAHIRNFKAAPGVDRVAISEIYEWTRGTFEADASYRLPRFDSPDFFEAFDRVWEIEKFDFCIPIHDASLMHFSSNRGQLDGAPYKVAMNCRETVDIISDKHAMYGFFRSAGIDTPRTVLLSDYRMAPFYPAYIKPRYIDARGTERALFLRCEASDPQTNAVLSSSLDGNLYVVQELVSGTEYNLDFFCDSDGSLKSVVALKRLAMGSNRGISRGEIVFDDRMETIVAAVASRMRLIGANQLQVWELPDGRIVAMEVNGRFSGSSVFVREAGVDFFKYFIQMLRGQPVEIRERPRKLFMSTWESPFYYESPVLFDTGSSRSTAP